MDRFGEKSLEDYYQDVFRFLRGISADEYLAEELTQETFFRAWKAKESYRGDADMRVWLCSIAKNLYYTHYQKQKRMDYGINLENWEDEETEDRQFVAQIADRETAFQIHKVLHCLREPYKEIFSLRIFGELSFKEIGQLFHRSEHWACVTYHRAKEMIRREIESKGGNKNEDRL